MRVFDATGPFAGDKDAAADLRDFYLRPMLENGNVAVLDFADVELATQSFAHALIASTVREKPGYLDLIEFTNCNANVQSIIEIVVEYAQEHFD